MEFKLKVDAKHVKEILGKIRGRAGTRFIFVWRLFHKYMIARTDLMFLKLKQGGKFRGVNWQKFKSKKVLRGSQYIPSASASLMQNTKHLRENAAKHIFYIGKGRISFGSNIMYAGFQQKLRQFLFFEVPKDVKFGSNLALNYLFYGEKGGAEYAQKKGKPRQRDPVTGRFAKGQ
jgi:hypothetical protein